MGVSTILQLNCGGQFYCRRKPDYHLEKNHRPATVTDKLLPYNAICTVTDKLLPYNVICTVTDRLLPYNSI
jgi:hypothetical protein